MRKFELVLIIHAHQPIGNFEDVFERCYQQSYLPFVEVLERHPTVRMGLHYSGPLLEWIERALIRNISSAAARSLVKKNQVEILGGGFYEPILAVIPPEDCHEQIVRLAKYVTKHFGAQPGGAWLAERVWEPQLPSSLARAGVEYTLVDDNHFLGAGFEEDRLYGYYVAEDLGHLVKVLPGLKALRYLLPLPASPRRPRSFWRAARRFGPGASRRWATTWKNSECGRERTNSATQMDGSTASSRRWSRARTGWRPLLPPTPSVAARRSGAQICRRHRTRK